MKTETTSPTTDECMDWLWHDKEDPWSPESIVKAEAIRDRLLAAQEMARALEQFTDDDPESDASESRAHKALTAWREAGGE